MARVGAAAKAPKPQASTKDVTPKARDPFDLSSLAQGGPSIEVVTEGDKQVDLYTDPAFLNEIIHIQFIDTGDPNAPKMVELLVNTTGADGKTGGKRTRLAFQRGVVYKVPRFIFEVVAHAKTTKLEQVSDPRDPMNVTYVEKHSFFYPCQVVFDQNPKGKGWVEKVMHDPA